MTGFEGIFAALVLWMAAFEVLTGPLISPTGVTMLFNRDDDETEPFLA